MPRERKKENLGFPKRWCWRHGAIYYQVPKGQEKFWDNKTLFKLGHNPTEAYVEWAKRCNYKVVRRTIADILERYIIQITRTKKPQTRRSEIRSYKFLVAAMGHMYPDEATPQEVYKYVDNRTTKSLARQDVAMLSDALSKAVKWGDIEKHPFKGQIQLDPIGERDRYVEDWEINEVMSLKPKRKKGDLTPMFHAFIELNLILALRKANMLQIKVTSFTDEGIPVELVKKRKKVIVIFKWTDALRVSVDKCIKARPIHISPWLFCNRRGESYFNIEKGDASGFDSSWDRFMNRALAETGLKERFTAHDLRGKAGSDAETDERASEALTHDSVAVTKRHYRRKPARIIPLK